MRFLCQESGSRIWAALFWHPQSTSKSWVTLRVPGGHLKNLRPFDPPSLHTRKSYQLCNYGDLVIFYLNNKSTKPFHPLLLFLETLDVSIKHMCIFSPTMKPISVVGGRREPVCPMGYEGTLVRPEKWPGMAACSARVCDDLTSDALLCH